MSDVAWIQNIRDESESYQVHPKFKQVVSEMVEEMQQKNSERLINSDNLKECPVQLKITLNDIATPFRHTPSR